MSRYRESFATKATKGQSTVFDQLAEAFPETVHQLSGDTSTWAEKAKLDWTIKASDLAWSSDQGTTLHPFPRKQVFYRSDNLAPLAVVGDKFKVVQPAEVLDFYKEVSNRYGFKLALAGSVDGGRKIWAMASTPHLLSITKEDPVQGSFMMMTACDGSLATQSFFSSLRLRCLNQLPVLIRHLKRESGRALASGRQVFRMNHRTTFSLARVEKDLELMALSWDSFGKVVEALGNKKVTKDQALEFLQKHFYRGEEEHLTLAGVAELNGAQAIKKVMEVYETGQGQEGITGTAWGVVNAATRYLDHETRTKNDEIRIRKAWMDQARPKADLFQDAALTFVPKVLV